MCAIWMAILLIASVAIIALPVCVLVSISEIKLALGVVKADEYTCSRLAMRLLIDNYLKNKHNIGAKSDYDAAVHEKASTGYRTTKIVRHVVVGMTVYIIFGVAMLFHFWTTDICALVCAFCA